MLGMINPEKNAQHTAESMPIRQQDILTLVKANATKCAVTPSYKHT